MQTIISVISGIDVGAAVNLLASPSFKTLQAVLAAYLGLLWLSVIIWVTRDAINRSDSVIFQVFAILLNIVFPILGIILYLIIRPCKTVAERYYEDLEHRLVLESIKKADAPPAGRKPIKKTKTRFK